MSESNTHSHTEGWPEGFIPLREHLMVVQGLTTIINKWQYAATHDRLTGLLRPLVWKEEISERLKTGIPMGVLFVDLDNFKVINDKLGHSVGDGLLASLGSLIVDRSNPAVIAGRTGGDEFGIGVTMELEEEGTDPHRWMDEVYARAEQTAQRFVEAQNARIRGLGFGISIGVALSTRQRPMPLGMLLRQADESMREAKPEDSR